MIPGEPDVRAEPRRDFVLLQGLRETRGAFERWAAAPAPVLGGWFAGALAVALTLLAATWLAASLITPDSGSVYLPGVTWPVEASDLAHILSSNLLVLALHATACVAGFIAGNSMPVAASNMSGFKRTLHEKAATVAIAWVVAVTAFSLVAQAYALGFQASTLSAAFQLSPLVLILTVLPHALIELTAIFLPLAAWLIASRRGEWGDLLAATFVTVAFAIPMLLIAALVELFVWPEILRAVSPVV